MIKAFKDFGIYFESIYLKTRVYALFSSNGFNTNPFRLMTLSRDDNNELVQISDVGCINGPVNQCFFLLLNASEAIREAQILTRFAAIKTTQQT